MNKYKYLQDISNQTKSVEESFLIDDAISKIIDSIGNVDGVNLLFNEIDLKERKNDIQNEIEIISDISGYFTYKNAFSEKEIQDIEVKIMECLKEINAIQFAQQIVGIKKDNALKNFNLDKVLVLNDNILNLQSKIDKQKDLLKGIVTKIRIIEDDFLDNFNKLVIDVKENKIDQNALIEDLIDVYTVEAIEEYKVQAIISIINKAFAGVSIDKILEIIENRQEIKDVIGKYFNDVISGLKNVGANI